MKNIIFISSILLVFALTTLSFAQAQVQSGKWGVNTSTKGYTLNENTGDRSMTIEVSFAVPFEVKPEIIIGVTMLDATTQTNIRYNVTPRSVSRDGFTIKVATWSESRIFGIGGFWIAHAQEKAEQKY